MVGGNAERKSYTIQQTLPRTGENAGIWFGCFSSPPLIEGVVIAAADGFLLTENLQRRGVGRGGNGGLELEPGS